MFLMPARELARYEPFVVIPNSGVFDVVGDMKLADFTIPH